MATLTNLSLDMLDIAKRCEDKKVATVIELLHQENMILQDALAMECNSGKEHIHTIRTGLPAVTWGRLYKGIAQSKSLTQQVTDTTGFLEGRSPVDTRLLEMNPGKQAQIRMQEGMAFIEAMSQEMASGIFYHDTATTPEKFKGLGARYGVSGGGGAGNQIVKAGGSGSDNTSIWFVTWGDRYTHLLYPEGTSAGVSRQDRGVQQELDENGDKYYVEEEEFRWHIGVAVKDWRYNARIANIDVSDMQAGSVDLYKYMRQAYYKLQSTFVPGGRQAIYCNRDVMEVLDALATNGGSWDNFVRLQTREIEGRMVTTYRGIPIRVTDAILNTESAVA